MILEPGDSQALKNNVSGLRTPEENKIKSQLTIADERETYDVQPSDTPALVLAPTRGNGIGQ